MKKPKRPEGFNAEEPKYEWMEESGRSLSLVRNGSILWQFHFDKAEDKPYFHPVRTLDGHDLTWLRPADHIWHRGLWFSWKTINGINYWEEDAKTGLSAGRSEVMKVQTERRPDFSALLVVELSYHPPGQPELLHEERLITVQAPRDDGSYRMDWRLTFRAKDQAVRLDRTLPSSMGGPAYGGYAGLSFRAASSLKSHRVLDSTGWENTAKLVGHGRPAKWMDFSGVVDEAQGRWAGVAFLDHTSNFRHPSPWYVYLSGDFGYFSPALLYDEPLELPPNGKLGLFYRLVIHSGKGSSDLLEREWELFSQ